MFCLRGTAEPEETGTPVTGMCAVPCASETAAKASTETEACNIMMRFGLNECVVEEERKRTKESCERTKIEKEEKLKKRSPDEI